MKMYATDPEGKKIELGKKPQNVKVLRSTNYAYARAWEDLRNKLIDELTVNPEGYLYAEDLKKAMDEMLVDYEI